MKLAEALILRADYQKRIQQLRVRLEHCVKVQEGEEPAENPKVLLSEIDAIFKELTGLIQRINRTNCSIRFDEKRTLADALVERDLLLNKRGILAHVAENASIKHDRFSRSEVKFISTIDVADTQKEVDQLSREFRELDTRIQGMNWTIDLM
ncbi:MAG TPA: DIP1984 family protein [Desulfitobacterium dehalogenans]|uniref:DIP1984 family protein n=1 Tax=Desulfitobacterium dehalogenans TaxID=36854 RepID=A0A7C7D8V0_9FIRM|nr:DIP1984 family protein [Desulfitobacterium dehalogenans]